MDAACAEVLMPNRLDFVLVVLFAIAWPLYELLFGFPRFKRALMGGGPGVRIRAYARAMATQWIFAGLALFVWARFGRPLARIGLGAPTGARFAVTLLVAALVAAFLAWQNRMIAASAGALWVPMLVHAMVDMNSGRLGYLAANAGDVDVRAA